MNSRNSENHHTSTMAKAEDSVLRRKALYQFCQGASLSLALAAAAIALLMLAAFLQLQANDPLSNPALAALVERLANNPEDAALQDQVRQLDLLVRKAYFAQRHHLQTGGLLLLVFSLGWIACVILANQFRPLSHAANHLRNKPDPWQVQSHTRHAVYVIAGVLLVATLAVGAYSRIGGAGLHLPKSMTAKATGARAAPGESSPATAPYEAAMSSAPSGSAVAKQPPPEPRTSSTLAADSSFPTIQEQKNNWPAFRGPFAQGVAYVSDPPVHWDGASGEGIAWKVSLPGTGFSSPVIWGDRLFLTIGDESAREMLCYDTATGDQLWRSPVEGTWPGDAEFPDTTEDTGLAAATPATDGRRVFAIFATGELACWDLSGQQLWGKFMGVPDNPYGHASSLLTFENMLYVQFDHGDGGNLYAFDVATGSELWHAEREVETSWATPVLVLPQTGDPTLVLNAAPYVMAYHARTGEKLWERDCMFGEVAPSATWDPRTDTLYLANQYASAVALERATGKILWQTMDADLPDVASPLVYEGHLYLASGYGPVDCLDAKTGELLWYEELPVGFYASPVLANGLLYFTNREGDTYVLQPGGEYRQVALNPLGEVATSTPVFTGFSLYFRGATHLFRIDGFPGPGVGDTGDEQADSNSNAETPEQTNL